MLGTAVLAFPLLVLGHREVRDWCMMPLVKAEGIDDRERLAVRIANTRRLLTVARDHERVLARDHAGDDLADPVGGVRGGWAGQWAGPGLSGPRVPR